MRGQLDKHSTDSRTHVKKSTFGQYILKSSYIFVGPAGLHPFSDTSNLQLVHATQFVMTAMD